MNCIYCGCTESWVVDSRPSEDGAIRRRRECENCQRRFTTYEKIEMLHLRQGNYEGFVSRHAQRNRRKTG